MAVPVDDIMQWVVSHQRWRVEDKISLHPLTRGGSGRQYWRVSGPEGSVLVMVYDRDRKENILFASIGQFLANIGVPVPHIVAHDEGRCMIMLEDLGDVDLWSYREARPETRMPLYRLTLEAIHKLHAYPLTVPPVQHLSLMEGFDRPLYRWEREYFREHLVEGLGQLVLAEREAEALEEELSSLAERLLSLPSCLVHRDFQSKNVMIRNGRPYFIDFQGLRLGNPLYDVASLLYDPYVSLSGDERTSLARQYYELANFPFPREIYCRHLLEAAAQRLMQALGAYGFLGSVKGYGEFLAYVPPALRNLVSVTAEVDSLPCLHVLGLRLMRVMGLTREG